MESQYFYGKTWFPNTRKEATIESCLLHCDKSNIQKIKIGISIQLQDGKQVGMPDWVGRGYNQLVEDGSEATSINYPDIELKEMVLDFFESPGDEHHSKRFMVSRICGFAMRRGDAPKREGALPPVWVEYTAYVDFSKSNWGWIPEFFRPGKIFVSHECKQQPLPIEPKKQLDLASV